MPNLQSDSLPKEILAEYGPDVVDILESIQGSEDWTISDAELDGHLVQLGRLLENRDIANSMLANKDVLESLCIVLAFINVFPRFSILEHIGTAGGLNNQDAIKSLLNTRGDSLKSETAVLLQSFLEEMQRQFALKRIFSAERLRAILSIVGEDSQSAA